MLGSKGRISVIFSGDVSHELKEINAPVYNIVAIHGMGHVNSSEGLWTSKLGNKEVSWLTDLLPIHATCAHVMGFTYPNKHLWEDISLDDIKSMAITLLDQLENHSTMSGYVMFVAHDLGGFILKEALSIAVATTRYHKIAAMTSLLVFFATPHRTLNFRSWESIANWLMLTAGEGEYNLTWISKVSRIMEAISKDFEPIKHIYKTINIFNKSLSASADAAENFPTWQVLDSYSASMGAAKELTIGRDKTHSELTKFSTDSDEAFIGIYEELRQSRGPGLQYIECLSSFSELLVYHGFADHPLTIKESAFPHSATLKQLENHESYKRWLQGSTNELYIRGRLEIDIVDTLSVVKESDSTSVIRFNCCAIDGLHYDSVQLLAALCHQILCLRPHLFDHVSEIYKLYVAETTWRPNWLHVFFHSLIECPYEGHTVCLIQDLDALQNPMLVLEDLITLAKQDTANFKFLVTIRSGQNHLDHLSHKSNSITIAPSAKNIENTMAYAVKSLLLSRPRLSTVAAELKELLDRKFRENSYIHTFSESSMLNIFQTWLALLVDHSNPSTKFSIKESGAVLQSNLEEMYCEILRRIPNQYRQTLGNAISWLAHSFRPLKLSELAIAAILDQDRDPQAGLEDFIPMDLGWELHNILGHVIQIENDQIVHIDDSFRSFILSKGSLKTCEAAQFSYQGHWDIAKKCLRYISRFVHDGSIQSPKDSRDGDLLLYAVQYWPDHYKQGKSELPLDSAAESFVSSEFHSYFHDYSLIQAWAHTYVIYQPQRMRSISNDPLCVSADVGCQELVQALLDSPHNTRVLATGLEISIKRGNENLAHLFINSKATTLLATHIAAAFGQEDLLPLCHKMGADPSCENEKGFTALHCACESGYLGIVIKLLDQGLTAELTSSVTGQTPLHIACQFGHIEIIAHLLDQSVDPNKGDASGLTPLHAAVKWQQTGSVRALVGNNSQRRIDMNAADQTGYTALHLAAESSRVDMIKLLLETHENELTDHDNQEIRLEETTWEGLTPLHIAASRGHSEIVGELLRLSPDQDSTAVLRYDNKGFIPLHLAIINGCPETVGQFLCQDVKVSDQLIRRCQGMQNAYPIHIAVDTHNYTIVKLLCEAHEKHNVYLDLFFEKSLSPLHLASIHGQLDIAKLLLEHDAAADVIDWYDRTPLYHASKKGYLEIVQKLLEKGADPNVADDNNVSPLLLATEGNYIHVVELLLQNGANSNDNDIDGNSPLLVASRGGNAHVVNLLLKYKADQNIKNDNGSTALSIAAAHGHADIVDILLPKTVDPNMKDDQGLSPLLVAAKNGHSQVVQLLLENIAVDSETSGPDKKTVLHFAANSGDFDTIKYLLEHPKINPNIPDSAGSTPLHSIVEKGSVDMVKEFLHRGANVTVKDCEGRTPLDVAPTEELMLILLHSIDQPGDHIFDDVLYQATSLGYLKVLETLHKKGVSLERRYSKGYCLYHIAARNGLLEPIQLLIQFGISGLDSTDSEKRTPISYAVERGKLEIVRMIAKNAPWSQRVTDNSGKTSLFYAAGHTQPEVIDYLLESPESRADINVADKENRTPLWIAAREGHMPTVQSLLRNDANATIANKDDGWTPLHCAAYSDHPEIVELLSKIEHVRDIPDNQGKTALFLATYAGNKGSVLELIKNGAADRPDNMGWRCLHAAYDRPDILEILLKRADVDVNAGANDGATALHLACVSYRDSVAILLQAGADPLKKDSESITPLHIAVTYSQGDTVSLLLKDINEPLNMKDNHLQTPLMLAIKHSNTSAIECLLKSHNLVFGEDGEEEEAIVDIAVEQFDGGVIELILKYGSPILSAKSIETFLIWAIEKHNNSILNQAKDLLCKKTEELTKYKQLTKLATDTDDITLASFILNFKTPEEIRDDHNWSLQQMVSASQLTLERDKAMVAIDNRHLPPHRWNIDPDHPPSGIELLDERGLQFRYAFGPTIEQKKFFLALSDHPIPLWGKLYFEIEIIKGNQYYMAIGFGYIPIQDDRMPGWDSNTWGWHGDDGGIFHGAGFRIAENSRWKYGTGDIISCSIDTAQGTASFFKNGKEIEKRFTNISGRIFPIVALGKGAEIVANFGGDSAIPFKYSEEQ